MTNKYTKKIKKSEVLMKKSLYLISLIFGAMAICLNAEMINGVEIYKSGQYPVGKNIQLENITGLNYGKMSTRVFLEVPLVFKNDGTANGHGGLTYTAKVSRTWLGSFVTGFTQPNISDSVFRITFPYRTPFRAGDTYNFTANSPITIVEKERQLGSNGKNFDVYTCIYESYLRVNNVVYPAYIPKEIPLSDAVPQGVPQS